MVNIDEDQLHIQLSGSLAIPTDAEAGRETSQG